MKYLVFAPNAAAEIKWLEENASRVNRPDVIFPTNTSRFEGYRSPITFVFLNGWQQRFNAKQQNDIRNLLQRFY